MTGGASTSCPTRPSSEYGRAPGPALPSSAPRASRCRLSLPAPLGSKPGLFDERLKHPGDPSVGQPCLGVRG